MAFYLSADTILDRVALCCAEIGGIVKVYRYVPTNPLLEMPCIVLESFDRTSQRTSEAWAQTSYTIACLVYTSSGFGMDTSEGYTPMIVSEPYEDAVEDYFLKHPYLNTDAGLGGLAILNPVIINLQHGRMEQKQGGGYHLIIPFQLTLELDRAIS